MAEELIIYPDPFRLRVQMALAASLEQITPGNGYVFDFTGKVFRGRDTFGDSDPMPMLSILEPPLPIDQNQSPALSTGSNGLWDLVIQGFAKDDKKHPTDPAHRMMADVKRRLAWEKSRTVANRAGQPNPFGMGVTQIVDGKGCGNIVETIIIGPGVVRPPEIAVSNKAFFWLTLTLKIVEDIGNPFV